MDEQNEVWATVFLEIKHCQSEYYHIKFRTVIFKLYFESTGSLKVLSKKNLYHLSSLEIDYQDP